MCVAVYDAFPNAKELVQIHADKRFYLQTFWTPRLPCANTKSTRNICPIACNEGRKACFPKTYASEDEALRGLALQVCNRQIVYYSTHKSDKERSRLEDSDWETEIEVLKERKKEIASQSASKNKTLLKNMLGIELEIKNAYATEIGKLGRHQLGASLTCISSQKCDSWLFELV